MTGDVVTVLSTGLSSFWQTIHSFTLLNFTLTFTIKKQLKYCFSSNQLHWTV